MEVNRFSGPLLILFLLSFLLNHALGNINNTYHIQALFISAETPKVILQQGTAGNSTIYTNDTSAKVSVSTPVGINHGVAFKASDVRVSTTSGSPVDDPEAVLNITLPVNSSIFVIYNAGNKHGSVEDYRGKGVAINIDGEDVAFSWQSPFSDNYANAATVIYATNLTAGSHVIKGRFFANIDGATVGIDTRQIVALWFPNALAKFVRSTKVSTTTSGTPVDDPEASLTFTLNTTSVTLVVYNVGNKHGSAEPSSGKGITINVDGKDLATRQWQSPYVSDHTNSVTIVAAGKLAAGTHTVKGRFFSGSAGSTTTIDERQLMVFCFPENLVSQGFAQSTVSVSTSSGTPVDDTEAYLSGTLDYDSNVLIIYVGGNPGGATENYYGKGVLIQIDGTDESNSTSWQSPYGSDYANSVTSLWCAQLPAGSHVVKGRFFANSAGSTVTIAHRQFLALTFPRKATYDYVLEVSNQVSDDWKIRLTAYNQSNIERLSNCTIYFYDGDGSSRQIQVYDGTYDQNQGNWYNLTDLSTVYIALSVLANSTETSLIHTHLEILVPVTSTYNLLVITFDIS
jgi:hypothetical protein